MVSVLKTTLAMPTMVAPWKIALPHKAQVHASKERIAEQPAALPLGLKLVVVLMLVVVLTPPLELTPVLVLTLAKIRALPLELAPAPPEEVAKVPLELLELEVAPALTHARTLGLPSTPERVPARVTTLATEMVGQLRLVPAPLSAPARVLVIKFTDPNQQWRCNWSDLFF